MIKSFWKYKPLIVQEGHNLPFGTILDKIKLQDQIQKDIDSSKINFDYSIQECIESTAVLEFINTNYITKGSTLKLKYSRELYTYFCDGKTICIAFYHKTNMVGFIVGKIVKVYVNGLEIDTLEVNFLCLLPQLRSLHASSYMISILSKICLEKFDVVSAVYTVGKKLTIPSFCTKHYYHRPLNITKMISVGLINNSYDTTVSRKVYGTFNYKKSDLVKMEYYNNCTESKLTDPNSFISHEIPQKLMSYNKKTFTIFDIKSQSSINGFFNNDAFHTFVFKNETGCITDMVTIYNLDTINVTCGESCRNGYVYCYFFDNDNTSYQFDILERICQYCTENNIFDMITVVDCFGLCEKEYYTNKFLKGSGSLCYYFYNAQISQVCPKANGLVTI